MEEAATPLNHSVEPMKLLVSVAMAAIPLEHAVTPGSHRRSGTRGPATCMPLVPDVIHWPSFEDVKHGLLPL